MKRYQMKRYQMKRYQTEWNDTKWNETTKWNDTKWSETIPNETKLYQIKWNHTKWNGTIPNQSKRHQTNRNKAILNKTKRYQLKRSDTKWHFFIAPILLWWSVRGYLESNPFGDLNICLERLHHATKYHDKARSNHWCQWPVLLRTTYRTVSFCNWDVAYEVSQDRFGFEYKLIQIFGCRYTTNIQPGIQPFHVNLKTFEKKNSKSGEKKFNIF